MMKTCSPGTSRFDENDSFAMGEYVTVKISTKTHLKSFANKMNEKTSRVRFWMCLRQLEQHKSFLHFL